VTRIRVDKQSPQYVDHPPARISVVILTLNEEVNIVDCLASCVWCDDVHVLDSGSTDRTAELAEACGASVHTNPFESFGQQRNWAIDHIPAKYDWIFHLDADERFTPEIVRAMHELVLAAPGEAGFYVPNKLMFMGRWLKRTGSYPTYQMRLFHKERVRFADHGHGQREKTDGVVGTLDEPYLHYPFSKGLFDWIDKHNRYSSLEALQAVSSEKRQWGVRDLFFGDKIKRRRAWKEFSYELPMRPTLRWFATMFLLGGFLDGRPGFIYARLIVMYERMIALKLKLLRESTLAASADFEKDTRPKVRTKVFDARDRVATASDEDRRRLVAAAAKDPPPDLEPPSVVVLTKNEQINIEACLRCLDFSDDIVVLDSYSTDRTVEIAERFENVRVVQRVFDTEYKQRNYGLHDVEFRHPWVYVCDADERVPVELRDEILRVINDPEQTHSAFRLRYKNMFMGRWIKRATNYPVWIIRLVRPDRVSYEVRQTNVHPIVDGTTGDLQHHFTHYSFNAGLRHWLGKHNFYSDAEAVEAVAERTKGRPSLSNLFTNDTMSRRRAFKNLSFFLKGRAFWRFVYNYVWCRGFLDGRAGLHYAALVSMYEYWIEAKMTEQRKDWRERTDALLEELLAEPVR